MADWLRPILSPGVGNGKQDLRCGAAGISSRGESPA